MPPKSKNTKPSKRYVHPNNALYFKNLSARLNEDYNEDLIANKKVFQNEVRQANLYKYATPNPKVSLTDPKAIFPLLASK